MPLEHPENSHTTTWFGGFWNNLVLIGEAIEMSDVERIGRRVAALEAAAAKTAKGPKQE